MIIGHTPLRYRPGWLPVWHLSLIVAGLCWQAAAPALALVDIAAEAPKKRPAAPKFEPRARFRLAAVKIEGLTVYRSEDLRPLYDHLIEREITLAQVAKLAQAITAHYRNDGYILARAIVPPQRISDGVVRIRVIEGYINEVIVPDDLVSRHGYFAVNLFRRWAARIKASRPLRTSVLERYTLLANGLYGMNVKAVMRPAKNVPGAADLEFVIDKTYYDVTALFDNRAPKTSGPYRGIATLSTHSLLGLNERLKFTYSAATEREESELFGLAYDGLAGADGTSVSASINRSRSEPGDVLKDLGLKSKATTFDIGLSYPVIRSRRENLIVSTAFIVRQINSSALSTRLFEDRLRILRAGAAYEVVDRWDGVNTVGLDFYAGLDILGATDAGEQVVSRQNASGTFYKFTGNLSRLQPLGNGISLLLSAAGQVSLDALLASEEFGFGGETYGRAYDPSELTGDHGIAALIEIRYRRTTDIPFLNYYQLYGFWDFGATFEIDPINQDSKRSASSAGIGLRFGLAEHVSGYLELAKPLTRAVAVEGNGKKPRYFFRIAARF